MVKGSSSCGKRCYKLWRRIGFRAGSGEIRNWDRKLTRARLVAREETRSRRRGQDLCRHAWESWAERYGMEPGMPHVPCFLAGRITQPHDCPERAPGSAGPWSKALLSLNMSGSRQTGYAHASYSQASAGQDREDWLPLIFTRGGRTALVIHSSLWDSSLSGATIWGPMLWGLGSGG